MFEDCDGLSARSFGAQTITESAAPRIAISRRRFQQGNCVLRVIDYLDHQHTSKKSSSSRVPLPEQPAGTYTPTQLAALAEAAHRAMPVHLIAAADYVSAILGRNNIPIAIMGGFSLGATEIPPMSISRVLRPLGPVSGVMRVFVKTGGQYESGLSDMLVEVDLILRGSLGAPEHPESAFEVVSVNTSVGPRQYRLLNLEGIMTSKLGAAFARSSQNDIDDILFLIAQYPAELWGLKANFSIGQRQHFINHLYQIGVDRPAIKKAQQVFGLTGFVKLQFCECMSTSSAARKCVQWVLGGKTLGVKTNGTAFSVPKTPRALWGRLLPSRKNCRCGASEYPALSPFFGRLGDTAGFSGETNFDTELSVRWKEDSMRAGSRV
nr:hypothetical protein CFP56_65555 [Quercus suber]